MDIKDQVKEKNGNSPLVLVGMLVTTAAFAIITWTTGYVSGFWKFVQVLLVASSFVTYKLYKDVPEYENSNRKVITAIVGWVLAMLLIGVIYVSNVPHNAEILK